MFGNLFGSTSKKAPPPPPFPLSDLEKIKRFAFGEDDLRAEAVEIHRRLLGERPDLRDHVAMRFMSEIDTPSPDLGYRRMLRDKLLASRD